MYSFLFAVLASHAWAQSGTVAITIYAELPRPYGESSVTVVAKRVEEGTVIDAVELKTHDGRRFSAPATEYRRIRNPNISDLQVSYSDPGVTIKIPYRQDLDRPHLEQYATIWMKN